MLTRYRMLRIDPPHNASVMVVFMDIMFIIMAFTLPMCCSPSGLCYGAGILIAAPVVTFVAMLFLSIPLSLEGRNAAIPGILAGCMWQVCA